MVRHVKLYYLLLSNRIRGDFFVVFGFSNEVITMSIISMLISKILIVDDLSKRCFIYAYVILTDLIVHFD